jgi:hypothetical protein
LLLRSECAWAARPVVVCRVMVGWFRRGQDEVADMVPACAHRAGPPSGSTFSGLRTYAAGPFAGCLA